MKNSIKPLKIGLVLDDSLDRNDGVQQYVRALGDWLEAQGHTVHFLAGQSKSDGKTIHSLSRNINARFNGNRLSMPLPASKNSIKKLLAQEKYDVMHVQMPYSPFMAGKIIGNALPQTAIVGTFHVLPYGPMHRYGSKTLGLVQKRTLNRFDAICSVSKPAAEFGKSHFSIESTIIPNAVDLKRFETPLRPHVGRIVFLGRLVPRKGCMELLRALQSVRYREVLIAGDGPERGKLQQYVESNNLDRVAFLGHVSEAEKPSLLASADIAVFPSLGGESFGIVLIEAMAAGAGVVLGGNNPGYQSVLSPWPKVLFDPRDTKAFSALLQKFLENKSLRTEIHGQQQTAVKQYDVNIVGNKIINLYHQALLHSQQNVR